MSADVAWMQRANCIGEDPELFFPRKGSAPSVEAMTLCGQCPVRQECVDYASFHGLKGIWGGTSESGRKGRSFYDQNTCRNGHERTPENTKVGSTGRRRCRECITESSKRAYAKRKSTANAA